MTTKIAFLGSHSTAQKIVTWILKDFRTEYRLVTARALTTHHKIVSYLRVFFCSLSRPANCHAFSVRVTQLPLFSRISRPSHAIAPFLTKKKFFLPHFEPVFTHCWGNPFPQINMTLTSMFTATGTCLQQFGMS